MSWGEPQMLAQVRNQPLPSPGPVEASELLTGRGGLAWAGVADRGGAGCAGPCSCRCERLPSALPGPILPEHGAPW